MQADGGTATGSESVNEKYKKRVYALEKLLRKHLCKNGEVVNVYARTDVGFRISEINVYKKTGFGTIAVRSYMQCDPKAAGVIFAAERYALLYCTKPFRPEWWSSDIDDRADAEWRLLVALGVNA